MLASSQTSYGHLVALTILPTPLFLISRDLLDRLFSSLQLLFLLPFIHFVTSIAHGLSAKPETPIEFAAERFRKYVISTVRKFIEDRGMLVSSHFVRTNSFISIVPARELITMQLSRSKQGSDSVLKLTDRLMSKLSPLYKEKLRETNLIIRKLLADKKFKRLKKRNILSKRPKESIKRKRYT